MIRLRTSLLLLAVAALLLSGTPVFAGTEGTGTPDLLSQITAPAAGQCTELVSSSAIGTPAVLEVGDFILCTCKFCERNPDVICQISPTGYSILCSDYYVSHNC